MKLITTIGEVQKFIPINMTSDIDVIAPFISNAELVYIKSVIGKEQFQAFVTAYETAQNIPGDIEDEVIKEAVLICQKIISNLGYYQAIPVLSVTIGSNGIQVSSNEQTKQAFQWQVEELKTSLLELGFMAIEELLIFMEESPDKFTAYIDSDQYQKSESFLVENAAEFTEHFDINGSRYLFQRMTYIMKRIEDQEIVKRLGKDFYEVLKSDTIEGNKKILVDTYLKPAIVLLTVSKAIIERIISLDSGRAVINFKGTYGNMKESIAPERETVKEMSNQLYNDGMEILQSGLEFIAANLSDMEGFLPQSSRRRFKVTNDKTKGLFGV